MDADNRTKRIALLVCYYGKFPWYFKFFVKSCSYNPQVDFIIITDIPAEDELPRNVISVNRSLEEVRITASEKLGFEVAIPTPYKFCDFKPAYGLLFEDLLEEYDFWGHGDIDVIYGNIRKQITDDMLGMYDVICVRPEYVSGFFTLFRNNEQMRNLFKESKDYQRVFQNPWNYCFDECNWNWVDLLAGKSIFSLKADVQCMTYIIRKLTLCGRLKSYFAMHVKEGLPGRLAWDRGTLLYNREQEILLYHLIQYKEVQYIYKPKWKKVPERFFIHPFYFSKSSPRSPMGVLTEIYFRSIQFAVRSFDRLVQYTRWLVKYLRASKRVKRHQLADLSQITGTYRNSAMEVKIVANGNKLFAEWDDNPRLLLLHAKGTKFLAGRFSIKTHTNIDIQFNYDAGQSNYTLHVMPWYPEESVLMKH